MRDAIRKGDKSEKFFFGSAGNRKKEDSVIKSEEDAQRRPRLEDEAELDRFRRLRMETARADRSMLLQVFKMVNGGDNS